MNPLRHHLQIAMFISSAMLGLAHSSADAQAINRCRIDGRLVIQSSPCPLDVPKRAADSSPLPSAPAASAGAAKKKTLADVLRERDGAHRPQPLARDNESDGANILRSRMGAV